MKIVIMAGGGGTRLWPLSREKEPKQFQKIFSDKTMLQEAVERLRPCFSYNDIYITTSKDYLSKIRKQLPKIPFKNLLSEPARRDTASCIAFACAKIGKKSPQEVVAVLTSDHVIKKKNELIKVLKIAEKFIEKNPQYIVTIGIKPTYPETGYGYIHQGQKIDQVNRFKIFEVAEFKEKPSLRRAKNYLKAKRYLWNSGMFIFRIDMMVEEFRKYIPDTYKRLMRIREAKAKEEKRVILREYPKMDKISIDYGIMENAKRVAVIPCDLGWSDVGSFQSLKDILAARGKNFIKGEHFGLDSADLFVKSEKKLVVTIGMKGYIVVDTNDILLICPKERSQDVKKIVDELRIKGKEKYL